MKTFIFLVSLFFVSSSIAESCKGSKPLVQPGCKIECKDGAYVQNCSDQTCGPKPVVKLGCKVGECVDGSWQMECGCGLKPIPNKGCKVTECKDGAWQEDCSKRKCPSMKPLTSPGCKVECVEGNWQQNCN